MPSTPTQSPPNFGSVESMPANVAGAMQVGQFGAGNRFNGLSDADVAPVESPATLWSRFGPQVQAAMAGSLATACVGALVLAIRRRREGHIGAALVTGDE